VSLHLNQEAEPLEVLKEPRASYELVETAAQLTAAITNLANGTGALAVDAERASGFKYSQRAYLVQLHRRGTDIYLIDPIAFDADALAQLAEFANKQEWILHAATQDLACLAELGLKPKQLFDTELISRLLGFERVGLGAVCEMALQMTLAKEHSAADWSTRPLPESWLNYAALDVDVLPDLKDYLSKEIEAQDKWQIVFEEMQHLLGFQPKGPKSERWRGMSSFHDLKEARQVAIAKALWEAREQLAQKLDVSPGRLVPDRSLVHAAKLQIKTKSQLANDKNFNGRASRTYLDIWWQALETGLNTRELPPLRAQATGIPNHRNWPGKFPDAEARLQAAKVIIAELSERISVPAENLLTPDFLRQTCFEPIGLDSDAIATQLRGYGAREWQIALVASPLGDAWSKLPRATSS
jgi:ribonuclease D